MISRKLLILLISFKNSELQAFSKYLASPYFNDNQDVIKLFSLIKSHILKYPNLSEPVFELSKKTVWNHLFGNKTYLDVQMRRLCSDLGKHARQFLAYQQIKTNDNTIYRYMLPSLNSHELSKHFISTLRKARTLLEEHPIRDKDYYFNTYLLESQCDTHLNQIGLQSNDLENFSKADYNLDCYYILQKLQHYCTFLVYKSTRSSSVELHHFPGFFEYISKSDFIKVPAIAVYYQIVCCFSEPEQEVHFQKLKILLNKYAFRFSKEELEYLYRFPQNFCAYHINLGKVKYYHELFDIYQTLIEKEIIFQSGGELDPAIYKNIITIGCLVKAFDWVEQFIQNHTNKLPKVSQDNDLNYNLAKVYFFTGQYEKVIEQLREVEYKNLDYALGGKLMLLKTYYELDEHRALDSLMDSFRIYLHRNKIISRDVKQQYMNVLRFVKKLAFIAPYDKSTIQKIKTQINNCKALADKKWILEKITEKER